MLQHQEENPQENEITSRYQVKFEGTARFEPVTSPQTAQAPPAQTSGSTQNTVTSLNGTRLQNPHLPPTLGRETEHATHSIPVSETRVDRSSSVWLLPFTPFLSILGFCVVFAASTALQSAITPRLYSPPAQSYNPIFPSSTDLVSTNLSAMQEGQSRFVQASDLIGLANGKSRSDYIGFNGANLSGMGTDQWRVTLDNGELVVQAWASVNSTSGETTAISSQRHGAYQNPVTVALGAFATSPPILPAYAPNPFPGTSDSQVFNPDGQQPVRGSESPGQIVEGTTVNDEFVTNGWVGDEISPAAPQD